MNHASDNGADAYTREETYAATRRPVDLAQTLLPDAYTSDAFFAIERERVFAAGWVVAGCVAQVREPGDILVAEVGGRSVFVVRHRDGRLRAFYNVCRHRGTRLLTADERRVGRFIRCPYHSWAYDHDGACVGTPLFTGSDIPADQQAAFEMDGVRAFDRSDHGLLPVAVDAWGPLVFVNVGADPAPLHTHLGDLPERTAGYRLDEWEIARTAEYEIAANYKLVGENFMEYYHLPWVHPGLVKVSPIEAHHRWQGPGMYAGFCTSPIAEDTDEGGWGSGLEPISGLSEDDAVQRAVRLAVPERRDQRAAQPPLRHARAAGEPAADARDDVPVHPPRAGLGSRAGAQHRRPDGLLGRRQPRGHRDRRARAGRARHDAVSRRTALLPLRGAGPSLPEHGRRPHGRRSARARG